MHATSTMAIGANFDLEATLGPLLASEIRQAADTIANTTSMPSLQRAASGMQILVHRVVAQAVEAGPLTRLISMLNDALTRRAIEIICRDASTRMEGVRWCWILLGSEGRQEQTLSSDQDNGIIFDSAGPADATRALLLPLARRINEALDSCGFPLCAGQVMASNPKWCLSLHEWRDQFSNWIIEGDPQALLNASIFFDLRPLYGAQELAEELANWLAREASENSRFLFQMSQNALRRKVPLGVIHKFTVDREGRYAGTIDLKVNAATLFVDAARIYGLSCGLHASNTADRFRFATEAHRLHPADATAWTQAFYFIQMLRLKHQQRCYIRGEPMHNHLAPEELDATDRRTLVDALRQARALHSRLALDYPGSGQSL